jgi:hypothetical protein
MFQKLFCSISLVVLLSMVIPSQQVRAESFSLMPIHDAEVGNDTQIGPDQNSGTGSGMAFRDIDVRRRVSFVSYDISELKAKGQLFVNVRFSNYGHDSGTALVYGVKEALDQIDETTITWNNAPGVQNNPTPDLGSPVALDYDDLTEELMSFVTPARGVREATQISQALADFLNNDIDGIVTFLFAPPAGQNNGIVRTKELGADGGTWLEGDLAGLPKSAYNPNPVDEEEDVAQDAVLSWTPGGYADTHNVYFGTVFDDVNEAGVDNPLGVLVSPGQTQSTYNPGLLDFGQIYYWRVDEVNAPPDSTVYKGQTWSFTVEPIAYPISGDNITASASSSSPGMGPEKTIDGSGLNDNDQHSAIATDMWQSSAAGPQPTWIKYEFNKVYKLYKMWVWNSNQSLESVVGLGLKSVTIEHSLDDSSWTQLNNVPEFNQATGLDDYTCDTTVNFNGVVAKYVRITANSNWGGLLTQYGLSEVRLFYIPVRARLPQPASGETGVALDAVLSWRKGRNAVSHEVYFGSDLGVVENNVALAGTVSDNSFALGSLGLELGKIYYWKVNEVNEADIPSVWEGDTWNFTTSDYLAVDDFEDYDDACERIYYSWQDGLGYTADPDCGVAPYGGNNTGSVVGNSSAPFAEQAVVHEGGQSMPMEYSNSFSPYYSETQRQWAVPQDWTKGGAGTLTVWFYGNEGNSAEQLYVAVEDSAGNIKVVSHTDSAAIQTASWQQFDIPFASFTGVNMTSVEKMYIGVGNRTAPVAGNMGKIYIDDIRLYP